MFKKIFDFLKPKKSNNDTITIVLNHNDIGLHIDVKDETKYLPLVQSLLSDQISDALIDIICQSCKDPEVFNAISREVVKSLRSTDSALVKPSQYQP